MRKTEKRIHKEKKEYVEEKCETSTKTTGIKIQ
jgi:hypothetical protein